MSRFRWPRHRPIVPVVRHAVLWTVGALGTASAQPAPTGVADSMIGTLGAGVLTGPTLPVAEPDLFAAVSLTTHDLLTASIDAGASRVSFAPGKLRERYVDVVSEVVIDVARRGKVTSIGLGAGWNGTAPAGSRGRRLAREAARGIRGRRPGEAPEHYEDWLVEEAWPEAFAGYRQALSTRAAILSAGVHALLFEVLSGTETDDDGDGRVDDAHALKGWDATAILEWRASPTAGFSAGYHFSRLRDSPEEGEPLVSRHGFSLSAARTIAILDRDYLASRAFRRSLFVPGIALGAAFEWRTCRGDALECEGRVVRESTLTPFVDVRIQPTAQFRLGLPIRRRVRSGGDAATELATIVQYSLQLARPD